MNDLTTSKHQRQNILNNSYALQEAERTKTIRSRVLDIVMDVLAKRTGGHTKFINQRDDHYLIAAFQEQSYRKQFTDALDQYIVENKWKYSRFTDLMYRSIFKEKAAEYRKVLGLIASYENGFAHELRGEVGKLGRKMSWFN